MFRHLLRPIKAFSTKLHASNATIKWPSAATISDKHQFKRHVLIPSADEPCLVIVAGKDTEASITL